MTRFRIIGIFEDEICTSTEFNGDGYYTGWGHEVCEHFAKITDKEGYEKLIWNDVTAEELNFWKLNNESRYYDVWFSDYLYIKNFTNEDFIVTDENGKILTIHPQGWLTINFGEFYIPEQEDREFEVLPFHDIIIDNVGQIRAVCESLDWNVEDEGEDLYISQYTPAGEDFGFSVNSATAKADIQKEAENFDVDEHVKMWIDGPGAPSSIRALLEDAEWLESALWDLADAIKEIK